MLPIYTGITEKHLGLGKLFLKLIAQFCNPSSQIGFLTSMSQCFLLHYVPLSGSVVFLNEYYIIEFIWFVPTNLTCQ